jgi:SAM-dependent methyltransferase
MNAQPPQPPYYHAYEQRYSTVYAAGVDTWGHTPQDADLVAALTDWVDTNNLAGKRVVEFCCGEGASGVILSKLGCIYTGYDVSPSAIEKANQTIADYPAAHCNVRDLVNEPITERFDAALDCMGFHMLITDADRSAFMRNMVGAISPGSPALFYREAYSESAYSGVVNSYEQWLEVSGDDYTTPQLRRTLDGVEIAIPLVPARGKNKNDYIAELTANGFVVDEFVIPQSNPQIINAVIIYAHKA